MFVRSVLFAFSLLSLTLGFSAPATATDQATVEQGKQVYFSRCAHCHGEGGQGDGHLVGVLKVKPADLSQLDEKGCVAKKVLGAVLGRHESGLEGNKMPLMMDVLSLEEVYAVTSYVETLVK